MLWPKFEDPETGLHLALTGAVKDDIYDRRDALVLLLQEMLEKYPQQLAMFYHITLDSVDTAETVMEKIGAARGCVKAGGVLDLNKVEQMDGSLHVRRTKITLSVSDHNLHKSNKNCRLNAGFFISGNDVAKRAGKAVQFKKAG